MKVRFVSCTRDRYDVLQQKDPGTLYFIADEGKIYKGEALYSHTINISDDPEDHSNSRQGVAASPDMVQALFERVQAGEILWSAINNGGQMVDGKYAEVELPEMP